MNFVILIAFLATFALAVDISVSPNSATGVDSVTSGIYVGVTNTASPSTTLTLVTYVVTPDSAGVTISYPGGAAKTTIGSIASAATGWGAFYYTAVEGLYNLNVTVSYKKSNTMYSFNKNIEFAVTLDEGGKREIVIDLAEVDSVEVEETVEERNNQLTLNAGAYSVAANTWTWVPAFITAGNKALKNVRYSAVASGNAVQFKYREGDFQGTVDGNIAAGTTKIASFAVLAPARNAPYNLEITLSYKRGDNDRRKEFSQSAVLTASGNGRSVEIEETAAAVDAKDNTIMYIAGASVGVAVVAALAVVGTITYLRKRSSDVQSA